MFSCFPDLLRKEGLYNGVASSVFLSEVREVTPPPPSPSGASRSSNNSQEEEEQESDETQTATESVMTRTFESIPRSTFWIPVDESTDNTEKNELSSDKTAGESSSNGTKFYIDLSNLEALASGQCSLCGESLPEGTPTPKGDTISSGSDKELCKSCKPRRRSSEEVFWIPFTEKRKAAALKGLNGVEKGEDSSKTNERRKSNHKISEQSITEHCPHSEQSHSSSSVVENSDSKALVLSKPSLPSSLDLTGYDVSCVCDNNTGVCSCTIVKKDMSSSSLSTEGSPLDYDKISATNSSTENTLKRTHSAADVVKTVGETSSLVESTLVARPTNQYASPPRAVTPSKGKSPAKKETDIILKSFSENDIHNPTRVGDTVKTTLRNIKEIEKDPVEAHQSVPKQGAIEPSMQEALDENGHDGAISNAPVEPSPPKQAWTTPRVEEPGASGVKIISPFPSPVPPENKSAVHPPIGPAGDNRTVNKKLSGGKKGKKSCGKTAGTCSSRTSKPRTKNKATEQNGKVVKKKGKSKKKSDIKMVTVQQREAGEELGLRTISQGGLDVAEESMDYLSTARSFNGRMFKGKHPILSPIPESPRSTVNTPRSTEGTPRVVAPQESPRDNSSEVQDGTAKGPVVVTEDKGGAENSEGVAREGEFDVVDGGMFSRVIGMCIPRLKFGKSDVDSDSGSDTESTEPLVRHPQGGGVEGKQRDAVEEGIARDTESAVGVEVGGGYPQVAQDEADDAMEDIVKRELSLADERESSRTHSVDQTSGSHNQIFRNGFSTDETSHVESSLSQANTGEESVLSYRYSRDFPSEMLVESDLPSEELTSSEASSYSEQYSDTDSSYNSFGSASPRPLSPASSLNSSDTYFSSPRDSSCPDTPTPDRETCSENSVEIDYYERMAREKSSISSSSSSSSTIRTRSNVSLGSVGNISQGSIGSFAGSIAENVVRSRLSASSRSQSCASCEEEIVWKKGNVLGRGAFGTVSYCN